MFRISEWMRRHAIRPWSGSFMTEYKWTELIKEEEND